MNEDEATQIAARIGHLQTEAAISSAIRASIKVTTQSGPLNSPAVMRGVIAGAFQALSDLMWAVSVENADPAHVDTAMKSQMAASLKQSMDMKPSGEFHRLAMLATMKEAAASPKN